MHNHTTPPATYLKETPSCHLLPGEPFLPPPSRSHPFCKTTLTGGSLPSFHLTGTPFLPPTFQQPLFLLHSSRSPFPGVPSRNPIPATPIQEPTFLPPRVQEPPFKKLLLGARHPGTSIQGPPYCQPPSRSSFFPPK